MDNIVFTWKEEQKVYDLRCTSNVAAFIRYLVQHTLETSIICLIWVFIFSLSLSRREKYICFPCFLTPNSLDSTAVKNNTLYTLIWDRSPYMVRKEGEKKKKKRWRTKHNSNSITSTTELLDLFKKACRRLLLVTSSSHHTNINVNAVSATGRSIWKIKKWEFPAHINHMVRKKEKPPPPPNQKPQDFKTRDVANTCATWGMTNCLSSFENVYLSLSDLKDVIT